MNALCNVRKQGLIPQSRRENRPVLKYQGYNSFLLNETHSSEEVRSVPKVSENLKSLFKVIGGWWEPPDVTSLSLAPPRWF